MSDLPIGVEVRTLEMHPDSRGSFTEIFRKAWVTGADPVQWSVVHSASGVLRGVHVHLLHTDYYVIVAGRGSVGLHDARRGSPTEGMAALLDVDGDHVSSITIPPGVLHGFYTSEDSVAIVGVSEYYDPADDLGCHWSDPHLRIPWKTRSPTLSERDATAPALSDLLAAIEPFQPIGGPAPTGAIRGGRFGSARSD
jgi:dTDP-4-dehydrorhamnose 3,5-epimerase